MTNTDNSRRKDDARPAETLHWDTACSICAGAGTTFGKTCVCRAAEAKRASLTDALRCAALDLLEHNAAAGACITIAGEPPLYVLVGAASAIGKLLPEAAAGQDLPPYNTMIRPAVMAQLYVSPGIPLSHELARLRAYDDAAIAAAQPAKAATDDVRNAALEEAANACDGLHHNWKWDDETNSDSGPRSCAKAIRALRTKGDSHDQ